MTAARPKKGSRNPPELAFKVLYQDEATGVFTGLFRIPPGGALILGFFLKPNEFLK